MKPIVVEDSLRPNTINNMEAILTKLLVADNAVILEGTAELREAFKKPDDAIPSLCMVLANSSNPQVRQYAAVILRKRLTKQKQWSKVPLEIQNNIKEGIIQVLMKESEKFVKNSVAQFVGVVAKHEMNTKEWPELLKLLQTLLTSEQKENVELGIYTLSVITGISPDAFSKHLESFSFFFVNSLQNVECLLSPIGYYTVVTMTHLIPLLEMDQSLRLSYIKSVPSVVSLVKHLAPTHDEKACECIDLFYELADVAVPILTPHIKLIIEMCLEIGQNKSLSGSLRNKALHLISWLSKAGKKSIIKNKLVEPIVRVLFEVISEPPEEEDEEDEDRCFTFNEDEDDLPGNAAASVLDELGVNLPPEKVVTPTLQLVNIGLSGDDVYTKRACYICLAVLSKGCADHIRTKFMKLFLECVCKGITDNSPIIRNAALFTVGQFSDYLQPEISEYAAELMPILFEYLSQLCTRLKHKSKEPSGVVGIFFALESFCQNLDERLLPYLPTLMERLLMTLDTSHSVHVQELSLSAISSAALAAKDAMLPYFTSIIDKLKCYLMEKHEAETICLQVQAVGTLAILARHLGGDHFKPLAVETLTLGKKLVTENDDPDLKQSVYTLFGALSTVMKEDMAPFLPDLVEMCIQSLKSTEGVVAHYKDDEDTVFPVYEDLSDTPDEEDIDKESEASEDESVQYTVENPYLEEKEEACNALNEFAENTGLAFLIHIERCFEEVYKLINYPHEDIKQAAIEALSQFCIFFSKVDSNEGRQSLNKALTLLIPKLAERVRMDDERVVVICALDAFTAMLKEIKGPVLEGEGHKEAIINCIKDVLTYKTGCQEKGEAEDEEEEDAEQDELLVETAGDIIPALGKVMPTTEFVHMLSGFLPTILNKLRKYKSDSQRSFFVGTIAECIPLAGSELNVYAVDLLSVFLPLTKDSNHEVRNNAVYGLGELVLHSKDVLFSRYNEILLALSTTLSTETDPGTLDNICGAIAKLILTNISLVPMDQVFPVFMQNLPLRTDFEENSAVLKCFGHLYQLGHPLLKQHISDVIRVCVSIVHNKQGTEEVVQMGLQLLSMCRKDFPNDFQSVLSTLAPEVSLNMNQF